MQKASRADLVADGLLQAAGSCKLTLASGASRTSARTNSYSPIFGCKMFVGCAGTACTECLGSTLSTYLRNVSLIIGRLTCPEELHGAMTMSHRLGLRNWFRYLGNRKR